MSRPDYDPFGDRISVVQEPPDEPTPDAPLPVEEGPEPLTVEELMGWLRRSEGRIEDIFGLWVQGKRDDRWVAEKLIEEGHLAALRADPVPDRQTLRRAIYSVWPGLGQDDMARLVAAIEPLLRADPVPGADGLREAADHQHEWVRGWLKDENLPEHVRWSVEQQWPDDIAWIGCRICELPKPLSRAALSPITPEAQDANPAT